MGENQLSSQVLFNKNSEIVKPEFLSNQNVLPFGPEQTIARCPGCSQVGLTYIKHKSNMITHVIATLFCISGMICCTCVPYCCSRCKTVNHYCSNCEQYLGHYQGRT
ncbi:lipopolysaccharide-induced tumor necrosis factor-alpha factor homolog [Teleopsis dalmanni]|uniref:lipopolysaccharide-induced tumor necrosis factor-alpha factor homolog n=1 Tax=Teleopsis dalmanni TaxID=139649 RepID=UPI0018CC7E44|nr:lipopolysaccharide-induced tumor necrosis factor-alpha factor homolog [Teleopsis dalmanni]